VDNEPNERWLRLWWWFLTLGVSALAVLLACCMWWTLRDGRLADESVTWPSVPGTILSVSATSSGGYRGTSHTVRIHYRFAVDGRVLEGYRASFGFALSGGECQDIVNAHPVGSIAQIHYRPGAPETNVVEPGGGTAYGLVVIGALGELILFPFICAMFWFGVKLLLPPPSRAELARRSQARALARKRQRQRARGAKT
jgi:hypothetical protein